MSKQTGTRKHRKLNSLGYTLAELLMVTGIIAVLAAVSIVAVITYQKQLKSTEMDATAKELFVAAQNHMTALKASGEWDSYSDSYASKSDDEKKAFFGKKIEETNKPSDYPNDDAKYGEWGKHTFYYLVVNPASGSSDASSSLDTSILSGFLPFGSIDETIRSDGSYVIEYDYATATVYGVFYTDSKDKMSYSKDVVELNSTADGKNGRTDKEVRKKYKRDGKSVVIGYYGGAMSKKLTTKELLAPTLAIENGDRLVLTITDSNSEPQNDKIVVEITGEESGNTIICPLDIKNSAKDSASASNGQKWWNSWVYNSGIYTFNLDDITLEKGHFNDLFCSNASSEPNLIPGENISIRVSCTSSKVLAATQYAQDRTNSLFATVTPALTADQSADANAPTYMVAEVKCVRHLQNLSYDISNLRMNGTSKNDNVVTQVEQTGNIDWNTFTSGSSVQVFDKSGNGIGENLFRGISNNALNSYKGNNFSIKGFTISGNNDVNAGLFAEIGNSTINGIQAKSQILTVNNLKLDSFTVTATASGNAGALLGVTLNDSQLIANHVTVVDPVIHVEEGSAGALVGYLQGGSVSYCISYASDSEHYYADKTNKTAAISSGGDNSSVGGLIGKYGDVSVLESGVTQTKGIQMDNSFSAISVETSGNNSNAGGLLGASNASIVDIKNCYSGGYTIDGEYSNDYKNIVANGSNSIAGGLIGNLVNDNVSGNIENCYSTASVYANDENGVAGGLLGNNATTSVLNAKESYATGYISGKVKGSFAGSVVNDNYFENCKVLDEVNQNTNTIGNKTTNVITNSSYDVMKQTNLFGRETNSYDDKYSGSIYPFNTVTTAGASLLTATGVHYGDWPKKLEDTVPSNIRAGLVYYEYINGSDYLYYKGYGNDKTAIASSKQFETEKGKYVKEEGYLLILPVGVTPNYKQEPENDDEPKEPYYMYFDFNDKDNYRYNFQIYKYLKKDTNGQYVKINVGSNGYVGYVLTLDSVYDNYFVKQAEDFTIIIHDVEKNKDIISGFSMNPHFADTVKLGKAEDNHEYLVRSARQFNQLYKRNNWGYAANSENIFTQNLDISFDSNDTGSESTFEASSTFYATYKTDGYKIRKIDKELFSAIYPSGNVSGVTVEDPVSTSQKSLFVGENRGTIENCKITFSNNESSTLVSNSEIAGFVYRNVGKITNCSVVGSILTHNGNVAGFAMENLKWKNEKIDDTGIYNCSIEGTITTENGSTAGFCYTNSDVILDSSCKGILNNQVIQMVSARNNAAGFVYTVDSGGEVKNCAAYGSTISENGDAAGFAYENKHKISECMVRAQVPNSGDYTQIQIHGKTNASGFVYTITENDTITDSYVVGTVMSDDGSAVGFCNTNKGDVTYCYANTMVTGRTQASGFLLSQANWNSVRYCASLLSVKATDGAAYGFSASNQGKTDNCYSALNTISGSDIYYFSPSLVPNNGSQSNSFYLDSVLCDASKVETGNQGTAVAITRSDLMAKTDLGSAVTLENTHSYHMTTAYPFPIAVSEGETPVFWGDWPVEPITYDYAWLNYEDYSGMKRYNNGNPQQIYGTGDNSGDTYGIWGTLVKVNGIWGEQIETIDTTAHLTAWDWIYSGFPYAYSRYGLAVPKDTNPGSWVNILFYNKREIKIKGVPYDFYMF